MTEDLAILAQLASANQTVAAHNVGPFSIVNLRRVIFILDIGALGVSGTVDFQLQYGATSGGSFTLVPNSAITQITSGSTNLVTVELKDETLAAISTGVGPWLKGVLTIGTAASQVGVVALGSVGRYGPASDYNVVTPAQQLVL